MVRAAAPRGSSLLHDGRLRLDVEPMLLPSAQRWLPRFGEGEGPSSGIPPAIIRVRTSAGGPSPNPEREPTLRLVTTAAWLEPESSRAILRGRAGTEGSVDLAACDATISIPLERASDPRAAADLFYLLTLASALLLVRLGRTMVHAGAFSAPDGRAWLLVGDTHAGKSTTCVNLIRAGWDYLSDDNVVLQRDEATCAPLVEGWPRLFHLDEGWGEGVTTGRRDAVRPEDLGTGGWRRTASLAGLIFPHVDAHSESLLQPMVASSAFSGLVRQAPWLLADPASAPPLLDLLREAALLPAYSLRLGLDTYRDPARLLERLIPLCTS
jgi:hypothetical protein